MNVIIIGAGLGGLALTHGLQAAGIGVQVLERRPSPATQPSSYGIHLNADGLRALHSCLPAENWARLDAAGAPARNLVRFHDEHLRVLAVLDNETPEHTTDPVTRRRAISRDALRDALLAGLNENTSTDTDVIQWGQQFSHYEQTPDGRVHVHSKGGRMWTADLLVGADGSNSKVRSQRLPSLLRENLGVLAVAGRIPLTPELSASLPASLIDGAVNNVVPAGNGWMFVSTWHAGNNATAGDTYAVWAWVAHRSTYPADIDDATGADLKAVVSTNIRRWAQPLQTLVEGSSPDTVSLIELRTMPNLEPWAPSPITLLGDAIHNMTPLAGIGANTALRDADALRRALTSPGDSTITGRVGTYEAQMRIYANAALALSTRNANGAAATKRLPRLAFRTILRVAEAIPYAKHKVFKTATTRTG